MAQSLIPMVQPNDRLALFIDGANLYQAARAIGFMQATRPPRRGPPWQRGGQLSLGWPADASHGPGPPSGGA